MHDSFVISDNIVAILDAAEQEFSLGGFAGAGMKAIAARAGVSTALLHYHYGTKDRLYQEVVRRRSQAINEERMNLLDAVRMSDADAIDGVIAALVRPPLGPSGGGRAYARIFAGLIVGQERDQALVRETYDPIALRFVEAIGAAAGIGRDAAGLAYTMTLGTLISVIARDGRTERLMGRDALLTEEEIVARITRFARGGIEALERRQEERPD
ncbi:TetR/AcrR family transcriptional regulator [Wenxinia saemankumensis]|uniref:Transcriptional regulator, TetR family n=1 Tax=Wenxinia saemankumensis TaxID=1447782 RepID=A0A1M6I218_9RHOB|nr:TetR/AcrR family transcriptional regulator [Wenxinia saemankumensis]SHJ28488.1 transcriptional regulator, TetR family [Wenxinia saemankumensis]